MNRLNVLVMAVALVICPAVTGQFIRIADTSTLIPGGSATFTNIGFPSVSNSIVAFSGAAPALGQGGIYAVPAGGGVLTTVVDWNTLIPGGTGTFTSTPMESFFGNTVVFVGTGTNQRGIYTGSVMGGSLSVVADRNTPIPGGTGNFNGMSNASISGTTVAFSGGDSASQGGIYFRPVGGGPLTLFANRNTPIPDGTGNFVSLGQPGVSVSDSTVLFKATGSGVQQGIYAGPIMGGSLNAVVDTNTPIPGGTGNFTVVAYPSLSGSTVGFLGIGSGNQRGIYTATLDGNSVTRIVDQTTPIPGGTGNFLNYSLGPSVSGTNLAFVGTGSGSQEGIYLTSSGAGTITEIISYGDFLDGRIVSDLGFFRTGLDMNMLAFRATFTDGSSGVYVTPVPEPGSMALLATASVAAYTFARRTKTRRFDEN